MDHNLEDSLNLESAIGEMDFEHAADVVVSQADITLDTGTLNNDGDIAMQFVHIQEQPMLMDPGNEEIIVSDFMSDQFSLQEYSVQDDQTTTATTTEESNQQSVLPSASDPLIEMQFEPHTVVPIKQEAQIQQPKYIAVKAEPARRVSAAPRGAPRKQLAIAPKPVALVTGKGVVVKKLPVAGVLQDAGKGAPVIAQIGKQLVMMPPGNQKIKLMTAGGTTFPNIQYIKANTTQAQVITNKSGMQTLKPIMAKVVMQGQSNTDLSNQQTVITKILPSTSSATPQARYVMQQKTVPISLGNKVLLASPSKQGVKFTKKQQIISLRSPTSKLMPAPGQASTTKKVVITATPGQNVILKTTAPLKTTQMRDGKVVPGQRSELHQINVPGKGIQYIRLITNQSTSATTKTVNKPTVSVPGKSFVLTDSKGNLIQMSAEKMISGQPPPLVFTGNTPPPANKWQQKLVRIAAAPPKPVAVTSAPSRSAQSLLAPLSPLNTNLKLEAPPAVSPAEELTEEETEMEESEEGGPERRPELDSKAALRALIADAAAADERKVEVSYEPESPSQDENTDSMEPLQSTESLEEQLIVIPATLMKSNANTDDDFRQEESDRSKLINMDEEIENSYLTPRSPPAGADCDMISTELGLRPRRACNCTKSQCLKLYCDCFANGEFCNRCNCNNCYNNLNYEELRQKAIRACLERNPNAFRPKIGKSKTGGPEIIRRHNKGCNCKRSGCLKNYCECYEAKIACTSMCKCFGCRNVEDTLHRARRRPRAPAPYRPPPLHDLKQPCSFMTSEVIEAVCQCLLAAGVDGGGAGAEPDPVRDVIDEFSRCLQDIIGASHHPAPLGLLDEGNT